jgi:hypothetical protein
MEGMDGKTVTCRYIFTKVEHRRAMRVFWFHTPRGLFFILFFIVIAGVIVALNLSDITSAAVEPGGRSKMVAIVLGLLPPLIFLVFMGFLFVFQTTRVFKKGPFFNQPLDYTIGENEIQMQSPTVEIKLHWAALTKWKDAKLGFIVYLKGGRSFHWLPYSGFQSPADIEWTRNILKSHAKA